LERTSESRFVPPYNIALVQAGLGETAAAFASLERGFDERDPHMVFLTVDPKWDALRGDERFDSLLRSCGMAKG